VPIDPVPAAGDIQAKVDAFSQTDSGGTHEQQRIGVQVVGSPEFTL
jgi:hypothetical protein